MGRSVLNVLTLGASGIRSSNNGASDGGYTLSHGLPWETLALAVYAFIMLM